MKRFAIALIWTFFCGLPHAVQADSLCGAKETIDAMEGEGLDILKDAGDKGPQTLYIFEDAPVYSLAKDILKGEYELSLSEMYQVGQQYDLIKCKGKITITLPDKTYAYNEIEYDVIKTEDGKTLVKWKKINDIAPIFATLVVQVLKNQRGSSQ